MGRKGGKVAKMDCEPTVIGFLAVSSRPATSLPVRTNTVPRNTVT